MAKPAGKTAQPVWRWMRRAPARHEDDWGARLSFLGPDLVTHGYPGGKTIRLEVYDNVPGRLRRMQREFGGKVGRVDAARIIARANAARRPLHFGRNLAVIDAGAAWPANRPKPRVLLRIGGAMAFGTGEHATTASCLRMLRDEAAKLPHGWTALDIGTGSGILAIAAKKLGAGCVEAFDADPRAVEAARENARRNKCSRVSFAVGDALGWRPATDAFRVVTANVYAEILCAAAPMIARAVAPGGCLLLSGILRGLESGTVDTFTARGFDTENFSYRGKWVTIQLRRRCRGFAVPRRDQSSARFSLRIARSAPCNSGNSSRMASADE